MKDDFKFETSGDTPEKDLEQMSSQELAKFLNVPNDTENAPALNDDFILSEDYLLETSDENESEKADENNVPRDTGTLPEAYQRTGAKKQKGKKGCLWSFVWILIIFVVAVGLALSIIFVFRDVLAIGKSEDQKEVVITKGMSTTQIAETLEDAGIIDMPFVFRLYSKLLKHDGTYRYGVYYLEPSLGYESITDRLKTQGQVADSVTVKIPEGASVDDIMKLLEDGGVVSKAKFREAMRLMSEEELTYKFMEDIPKDKVRYLLEGYLYPDTYQFFPNDSVKGARIVINRMLENLGAKLTDSDYKRAEQMNKSMHEIMTMASIVQLEAGGFPEDAPKVAAVFYNRMEWDEPKFLGSTPTQNYPDKRYNTNPDKGYEWLPPGPLCSPAIDSIQAALNPESGFSYTYFVTDKAMKFYYNKTLKEHNAIIAKLKRENNWVY